MCGFIGMVSEERSTLLQQPLEAMMNIISHRGPDDGGTFEEEFVRFGFKRLSIVDIENGSQPMSYLLGRYTIIFNGEIYNAPELREELRQNGAVLETSSDTEVILASYDWYGKECVNLFKGMFSFLIWDREKEELFGARDPFGIKPLFYRALRDSTVVFASEKKSLYLMPEPATVNYEAVFHYLTFQYTPEPATAAKQINKIQPGHYFTWRAGEGLSISQYWKPAFAEKESIKMKAMNVFKAPFIIDKTRKEKAEFLEKIKDTLTDSVKRHMRADVPVGAFLSGGIDSSAIVALARKEHPDLKTFTAEFEREGFSEGDIAEETAEALQVNHTRVPVTPDDVMREFPKIIWHLDEPVADPAAIPLYFVAKEASRHVKVVLSGEGADELFGGYNIYHEPHSLRLFKTVPGQLKPAFRKLAQQLPEGMKGRNFIIRGMTPIEERFVGNAKIFTDGEKDSFLLPFSPHLRTGQVMEDLYKQAENYDDVTKMQYIDMHTWLRGDILVKADKMTMAHSLELRVPFLDREVFDIASQLPVHGKISRGQTKKWLREALADVVPAHVLHRRKLGFPVPVRHWLKEEMYEWAETWIKQSGADHIFNKSACLKLLEDHRSGKTDASRKIWTILTYMIWHHNFMENRDTQGEKVNQIS